MTARGGARKGVIIASVLLAVLLLAALGVWLGSMTGRQEETEAESFGESFAEEFSIAHVEYSTTERTRGPVVATLVFDVEGEFTVLGDGETTHTFTKNGIHVFRFKDTEDNVTEVRAAVTWIASGGEG